MRKKTPLMAIMILVLLLSGASGTAGIWANLKNVTITSTHRSSYTTTGDSSVSYYTSGNNEIVQLKVKSVLFQERSIAKAVYDIGKQGNNGGYMSEGKNYGVRLRIYISGSFESNENDNTYFKIKLILYYMEGSNKKIAGNDIKVWTEGPISKGYYDVFASGYVPKGRYFFAEFYYELSAETWLFQHNTSSDLLITSYYVAYSYYLDKPGTITPT